MTIYRCELCKKIFSTRKEVREHLREVHRVKGSNANAHSGSIDQKLSRYVNTDDER